MLHYCKLLQSFSLKTDCKISVLHSFCTHIYTVAKFSYYCNTLRQTTQQIKFIFIVIQHFLFFRTKYKLIDPFLCSDLPKLQHQVAGDTRTPRGVEFSHPSAKLRWQSQYHYSAPALQQ